MCEVTRASWARRRAIALVVVVLHLGGCGSPAPPRESPSKPIVVAGAEHIHTLVRAEILAFRDRYPEADSVVLVANGSAEAMEQLVNGEVDMAILMRELTDPEAEAAVSRAGLEAHSVFWDAVAAIVHPSCPVEQVSRTELGQIYSGAITDWGELGWRAGGEISALTTGPTRGLYGFLEQALLGGGTYDPRVYALDREETIVSTVASRPGAIGLVSGSLVDGRVKALKVAAAAGLPAVPLNRENLLTRRYPLLRSIALATSAEPRRSAADLITFIAGVEGQRIAARHGYAPATVPVDIVRTATVEEE